MLAGDCFTQALTRLLPTVQLTVNPKEQVLFLKWKHTHRQNNTLGVQGLGTGSPACSHRT